MKKQLLLASLLAASMSVAWAAEPTVVLEETFDAFTEGSVGNPALETDISKTGGKLSTVLPGWSGSNVYEAGGALLVGSTDLLASGQFYLQTPSLGLSVLNGNVKITMRVKSSESFGAIVSALSGSYTTIADSYLLDGEWHDVVVVTDRSLSSYLRIMPYSLMKVAFYIDYLKVEQGSSILLTPTAYRPSDFNGTEFTARWRSVRNATSYEVNVYTYADDGTKESVVKQDVGNVTSYKVTVPASEKRYYYTVTAKSADYVSEPSEEQDVVKRVESLDAPVAKEATEVTETGFTANWEAVADAQSYTLTVYKTSTLEKDADVELVADDFSGITAGQVGSVEYGRTSEYLDNYTKQPGWYASGHAYAGGVLALAPFTDAAIVRTPKLDLSGEEGKFTVTVKLSEQGFNGGLTGGKATVNIIKVNDDESETVVETADVDIDDAGFKTYTLTFTKGFDGAYVEVSYAQNDNYYKLYIDEMAVSQRRPAGTVIRTTHKEVTTDGLSAYVEAQDEAGVVYSYTVKASVETVNSSGDDTTVYSAASNEITVPSKQSGVETAAVPEAKVYAAGGRLVVELPEAAHVGVYDLTGRMLEAFDGAAGRHELRHSGALIVRVGGKAYKAIVR